LTLLRVGTELGAGSSESKLVRAIGESAQQGGRRLPGRAAALTPERLIPSIVELFIAGDREFIKLRKRGGTGD